MDGATMYELPWLYYKRIRPGGSEICRLEFASGTVQIMLVEPLSSQGQQLTTYTYTTTTCRVMPSPGRIAIDAVLIRNRPGRE